MTTQSSVTRFLASKHLALAGASRSGKRFGNAIVKELTSKGYEISILHPEATEIGGRSCYPSVAALPEGVGGLILVVPPEQTLQLVREAAAAGITKVWMQQGAESPEAVKLCRANGIDEVHGECILMFADPRHVHRFHRWVWGLLGKLPEQDG